MTAKHQRSSNGSTDIRILAIVATIPLWGQERANINIFARLRERGVKAHFVTHSRFGYIHIVPYLEKLGFDYTGVQIESRVTKQTKPAILLNKIRGILRGSRQLARVIRDYKPTHIHIPNTDIFIALLPALLLARVPVLYRAGDVPLQHHTLYRFVWRHLISRKVERVVCNSKYVQEQCIAAGTPVGKTRVIYSSAPVHEGGADVQEGSRDYECVIAYAGQLRAFKGVDLLVEAAMRICAERDDVKFCIAGDYTWRNELAESLIHSVEESGLSHRIVFLGEIDNVLSLMESSDLHVLPSVKEEPLSNTLLEAKASSIPSVAFPSGGSTEVVRDGYDGIVCEDKSAGALYAGIERFLNLTASERKRMGENAYRSIGELGLDVESFTKEWFAQYEQTLRPKARRLRSPRLKSISGARRRP
jgi:glycosyltransferase involved in cell wall biosynthesis